jgi:hypothetical protein
MACMKVNQKRMQKPRTTKELSTANITIVGLITHWERVLVHIPKSNGLKTGTMGSESKWIYMAQNQIYGLRTGYRGSELDFMVSEMEIWAFLEGRNALPLPRAPLCPFTPQEAPCPLKKSCEVVFNGLNTGCLRLNKYCAKLWDEC